MVEKHKYNTQERCIMTEPKFEVFTETFDDVKTGITYNGQELTHTEVANLLIDLLTENQQLHQQIKDCIKQAKWFNNEIKSLSEENKELRKQLQNVSTK